jgi:1-acyl-sn-glycerol-3-phosphate acyltransferase
MKVKIKDRLEFLSRYFHWFLSRIFCFVYLRPKFKLIIEDKDIKIPKPPFIMVSNHATFFDPWLIGHLVSHPLSIMMNEEGFKTSKFGKWYLNKIGTFPKKKGATDLRAMRYTLTTLKKGYPVLIFPEGQTTWYGETQPILSGVESLVKRSGTPLLIMNIRGNFLSKPWWATTYRKGAVIIKRRVITADEISSMSKDEIRDVIIKSIYSNEFKDEQIKQTEFKGPLPTEGLTKAVWICPACKREDVLVETSDGLKCISCGAAWTVDTHLNFSSESKAVQMDNLLAWAEWQKKFIKDKVKAAGTKEIIAQDANVEYCDVTEYGEYPVIASGQLKLTRETLFFRPDDKSSEHSFEMALSEIKDYVFQLKTIFEFSYKGKVYKFKFKKSTPMKWLFYFRELNNYEVFEKRGYI